MDATLNQMTTLTDFLETMFGSIFNTFEFLASKLFELPSIFGLQMGVWVLLFMVVGIILGDFISD